MENGEDLILNISWHLPEDVQKAAIDSIVADVDFDVTRLLLPLRKKAYWENAAICLQRMGYPRNLPAINGMLEWLQDMNWPGAHMILNLLKGYPKEAFLPAYENAVEKACGDRDECWLGWLSYYVMVGKILREDFTKPELYDEMMRYNDDYWINQDH